MHEQIERFQREGTIRDDSDFIRLKSVLIRDLENEMRDYGVMPLVDISPQWTLEYDAEHNSYHFKLTIYGIEVGEGNCPKNMMYSNGKPTVVR